MIDPFARGLVLRRKMRNEDGEILCVDFGGTMQAGDIQKRNDLIQDVNKGAACYRAKINIKEIDATEREKKGLGPFDFSDETNVIRALNDDFDFPLWFVRRAGEGLDEIEKWNLPLAYQVKGCNFHGGLDTDGCTYCFVDDDSNNPTSKNSVWLSAKDIVDTFESARNNLNLHHIRISGGEPTLHLDHVLDVLNEMDSRGLRHEGLQFDNNLSSGRLIKRWIDNGELEKHILAKIGAYEPKGLAAYKGSDDASIQENTQSKLTLDDQINTHKMFAMEGINLFPSIYNPNPNTLEYFANELEANFDGPILNMIHLYPLNCYGPTEARLSGLADKEGIPQDDYIAVMKGEWANNYARGKEVWQEILQKRTGMDYKEIERPELVDDVIPK